MIPQYNGVTSPWESVNHLCKCVQLQGKEADDVTAAAVNFLRPAGKPSISCCYHGDPLGS